MTTTLVLVHSVKFAWSTSLFVFISDKANCEVTGINIFMMNVSIFQ